MPEVCHTLLSKVQIFSDCHAHRRQAQTGRDGEMCARSDLPLGCVGIVAQ